MKNVRKIFYEALPEILAALVAAGLIAVVNRIFSKIEFVVATIIVCVWIFSIYVAFSIKMISRRQKHTSKSGQTQLMKWKYPKWRRLALFTSIGIPMLIGSIFGYIYLRNTFFDDRIVFLVANFDGPNPEKYRVTETILTTLDEISTQYPSLIIKPLNQTIKQQDGSNHAQNQGAIKHADVVIWGWYGVTEQVVPVSVHIELINYPTEESNLCPIAKGNIQQIPKNELDSFTFQTNLSQDLAQFSIMFLSLVQYSTGNLDEALQTFNKAIEYGNANNYFSLSYLHFFRGLIFYKQKEYNNAINDFSKVLEFEPDYSYALFNRGASYYYVKEISRALADFDKGISINPYDIDALKFRSNLNSELKNYDDAINDALTIINMGYAETCDYVLLGNYYSLAGMTDKAKESLTKALELNGKNVSAYTDRGKIYMENGEIDKALKDINKALSIYPHHMEALAIRGQYYLDNHLYKKARSDFQYCLKNCDDPDICPLCMDGLDVANKMLEQE